MEFATPHLQKCAECRLMHSRIHPTTTGGSNFVPNQRCRRRSNGDADGSRPVKQNIHRRFASHYSPPSLEGRGDFPAEAQLFRVSVPFLSLFPFKFVSLWFLKILPFSACCSAGLQQSSQRQSRLAGHFSFCICDNARETSHCHSLVVSSL